jgi:hypothetical protein
MNGRIAAVAAGVAGVLLTVQTSSAGVLRKPALVP